MKSTEKVVIKKVCHYREMGGPHGSGNFLLRLGKIANSFCLTTTKQKGDPQRKPLGMTPNFMKTYGFTLIELLVVALIIGILAAVALPQYQKAVVKARASTILPLLKTLQTAEDIYYEANAQYTHNSHQLDVSMPADCSEIGAVDLPGKRWQCGRYWYVDVSGPEVIASYCPDKNTSYDDCAPVRDFYFSFVPARSYLLATYGSRRCSVPNDSAIGTAICVGFGGKRFSATSPHYAL